MLQCHVVQSLVAIYLYRWLCASQCNSKCLALVANIGAPWGLSAQLFFVASNVPRSMICIPNESLGWIEIAVPKCEKYVFNAITRFKVPKLIGWNWDQGSPFQTTPPEMFKLNVGGQDWGSTQFHWFSFYVLCYNPFSWMLKLFSFRIGTNRGFFLHEYLLSKNIETNSTGR